MNQSKTRRGNPRTGVVLPTFSEDRDEQFREFGYLPQVTEMQVAIYADLPSKQKIIVIILSQFSAMDVNAISFFSGMNEPTCLSEIQKLKAKSILFESSGKICLDAMKIPLLGERIPARKGFMYMMRLDSVLKIGFSSNIKSRMNSYRTGNKCVSLIFQGERSIQISDEKAFHCQHNHGKEQYSLDRERELLTALTAFDLEVV